MILAGDIGGTKTALGLYGEDSQPENPAAEEIFLSRDHNSLVEIVDIFLGKVRPDRVKAACFAVAGPILGGRASITNLPWTVQEKDLSAFLEVSMLKLINDVQAVACSVPILGKDDLHTLSAGRPEVNGTVAVIAPGTGLGQAFLTWDGKSYLSHPTEGGHADFGPGDENQSGLLTYMRARRGHVSWEVVCSGMGIPNIYDYLKSTGKYGKTPTADETPAPGTDRTPSIIRAALDGTSPEPLCVDTLEMFVSILGAESGNLALKTMATGGLYVGGGIPPRILEAIQSGVFMESFTAKGRLKPLMEEIPVHIILNPKAALMGAATEAFRMIRDLEPEPGESGM
ncbi:MAG: glucokinase [bacterium]|nr:MAG: glucokinase [bacterium]